MIQLKKRNLLPVILLIQAFNESGESVNGLLMEEIPLSLKRRLHRIRKDLLSHLETVQREEKEVRESDKPDEELKKELEILGDEILTINHEFVSLEMIEAIKTKANYNFEVIELIAR